MFAFINACTTIDLSEKNGRNNKIYTIGIVKLTYDNSNKDLFYLDNKSIGVFKSNNLTSFGINNTQIINIDPEKCSLVIIVKNKKSVENVKNVLEKLGKQSVCEISSY